MATQMYLHQGLLEPILKILDVLSWECSPLVENAKQLQPMLTMISWSVGDLGGCKGRAPPWAPKFFRFHAVFRKIWQNRMLAPPPGELAPPWGNPGSAADGVTLFGTISNRRCDTVYVHNFKPVLFL